MIFSEVYGLYFRAVEKLIEQAMGGKLSSNTLYEIASGSAFSESALFIESAIQSGEWFIIDKNYKTPYEFAPKMPLTDLEKRWIKSVTLDRRFSLFMDYEPDWLKDIQPLFDPKDIIYPDRLSGGDDFESESYRRIFAVVLSALKEDKVLCIEYISGKGCLQRCKYIPRKLEYSMKEDKFRLHTGNVFGCNIINISRIENCSITESFDRESLLPLKFNTDEVQFEITNERNCLERALIHFSSYEKETIRLDRKRYLVKMRYKTDDETEIIIRLLQFGQFIKVISPVYMVNQMKERIFNQKSCE